MRNLLRIAKAVTTSDSYLSKVTAKEMLWLVNNLLQDLDLLSGISQNANGYVQMKALDGEPYGEWGGKWCSCTVDENGLCFTS